QRASQVVKNLLRFSVQHKEAVRSRVDLNRLVGETLSLTETQLKEGGIALTVELDAQVPRLDADGGQIAQVLLNLGQNARAPMKQGGQLRVASRKRNGEVQLLVTDTGKGIDPKIVERIFEPFFTTKDEWNNVGLGLSVSYRIVSEHKGRIEVQS